MRAVQQIGLKTFHQQASLEACLKNLSFLQTLQIPQTVFRSCLKGVVRYKHIPSAIPTEESGCSLPLGLWVTKVKLFVFKCHGGLLSWESHNGSRLEPRASLPNCDHWLIDNPFMGCCSTIAVQQPIHSESQNQAQGNNSPPTSLKHGEIYCFHRNKSVWCPHSSCIPHWWASAPSCWGFKQVSSYRSSLEEKQEALPANPTTSSKMLFASVHLCCERINQEYSSPPPFWGLSYLPAPSLLSSCRWVSPEYVRT